ncbi:MAG: hypothetical protein JJ975_04470 [Bacteroidia bacterium]|nr:hypothetical protein [Bacteroidia bacterium]
MIRTLLINCLLLLAIPHCVMGQEVLRFSQHDSVYSTKAQPILVATTYLTTPYSGIKPTWKLVSIDLPPTWKLRSLCDNVLCYFVPLPDSSEMNTIDKGDGPTENKLELTVEVGSDQSSTGLITIDVMVADSGYAKRLYFVFDPWNLGLKPLDDLRPGQWIKDGSLYLSNPTDEIIPFKILSTQGCIISSGQLQPYYTNRFPLTTGIYVLQFLHPEGFVSRRKFWVTESY